MTTPTIPVGGVELEEHPRFRAIERGARADPRSPGPRPGDQQAADARVGVDPRRTRRRLAAPPNLGASRAGTDDDHVLQRLRRHLEFLGLTRSLGELDELLAWATRERPSATGLLDHILGREAAQRLERRIETRIVQSGLAERKTLEAFEWDFQPDLDKSLILELARLDFVRRRDDIVITGKCGTGKSHILKAFAMRACEQGVRIRYARSHTLRALRRPPRRPPCRPRGRLIRPSPQVLGAPRVLDHR